MPADILDLLDGVLLIDLWLDLALPRKIQDACQSVIAEAAR